MTRSFHSALVQAFATFARAELAPMDARLESKMNRILLQGLLALVTLQVVGMGILARILS